MKKILEEINLEITDRDVKQTLLPLLLNQVFHVTTNMNYKNILNEGNIHVRNEVDTFPQSTNSYGKKRGYICLFDLRNKKSEEIEDTLLKYYFINPSFTNNKPIFIILNKKIFNDLINWEIAKDEINYKEMYIPYTECWYPSPLKVNLIDKVIRVHIKNSVI